MTESSSARYDALVVDATLRQMLVATRSLGRYGRTVAALDWELAERVPTFASRWCSTHATVTDVALSPDRFVDDIVAFARSNRCGALIAGHDGSIDAIRRRRPEVEAAVPVALAPEPALAIATDKAKTLAVAAEVGVAAPLSVEVADGTDVRGAIRAVGLPAVAKPLESWVTNGDHPSRLRCHDVLTEREAVDTVAVMTAAGGRVALQEWLPGAREAVSFLHDGRTFRARFAQRALRMDPPLGGASVVRESIELDDMLVEGAQRLVEAIGLTGYSEVEFRRDGRGVPRLMEINPRLSASVEVAVRAGVDFPRLLHAWAAGEPITDVFPYRLGVRMRWLGGDLHWLASAMARQGRVDVPSRGQALAMFAGDCIRRSNYDYLAFDDLRPAWIATKSTIARLATEAPARVRTFRQQAENTHEGVRNG
jgi:predicted ATP-grasp superfamily ATP-dependent carboligase